MYGNYTRFLMERARAMTEARKSTVSLVFDNGDVAVLPAVGYMELALERCKERGTGGKMYSAAGHIGSVRITEGGGWTAERWN